MYTKRKDEIYVTLPWTFEMSEHLHEKRKSKLHFTERGFGLFTSRKMDRCCELYDLFQGCVCASCCVR